jgi:hypothetical protein
MFKVTVQVLWQTRPDAFDGTAMTNNDCLSLMTGIANGGAAPTPEAAMRVLAEFISRTGPDMDPTDRERLLSVGATIAVTMPRPRRTPMVTESWLGRGGWS